MDTPASAAETDLEQRMVELGRGLSESLGVVIGHMLDVPRPFRPSQLDRATGLGKNAAYQILKAVDAEDPMTVLHLLPGMSPLRSLLKVAEKRSVNKSAIATAKRSLDDFQDFIRREAGDRDTLDLIVSGWLPAAREKAELLARQSIFRGMSKVKGLSADVIIDSGVICPADDGTALDGVSVRVLKGFRRWRRGVPLRFSAGRIKPPPNMPRSMSLDGRTIEDLSDCVVHEFSSMTSAQLDVTSTPDVDYYSLQSDSLGVRSAADIAFADLTRSCMKRYSEPEQPRKSGFANVISLPARLMVLDVLLHRDAYPGSEPRMRLHELGLGGAVHPDDAVRDVDRLPMRESAQAMGTGVDGLRIPEVPRYIDLLRHAFSRVGWDHRDFRAYRCSIKFPLYASQVTMTFDCPPKS